MSLISCNKSFVVASVSARVRSLEASIERGRSVVETNARGTFISTRNLSSTIPAQ